MNNLKYSNGSATYVESLEKKIAELEKQIVAIDMNNEPVAWIDSYDLERLPHYDCHIGSQQLKNGIPLYTHPVKELTDEEILELCPPNHSDMMNEAYTIEFARAILRKAQEK